MTDQKPIRAITLFDLLARAWPLGQPVTEMAFNAALSAVACRLKDGRLALLPVADAEHPETRMRRELELGRTTIRPRKAPLPPPQLTDPLLAPEAPGICPLGAQGFAVARGADLWRVTARGQAVPALRGEAGEISALCAAGTARICLARGDRLELRAAEGLEAIATARLGAPVQQLAARPDGRGFAARDAEGVTLLSGDLGIEARIACPGGAAGLAWSPDGRWLAAGTRDRALALVETGAHRAERIEGFPAPVASAGFSRGPTGALVASGGYRVIGWAGPDLPAAGHPGRPLETGRPGFVLVERVAVHPARDLCAAGYASGLVTVATIGGRDELMLHEGTGAAVTALGWSADGAHLAIGFADGRAVIATFPKDMFK
ncbi:WD40 repeat domain-containing protein [Poseidonocella sp. HB161398]|uniref:WD40 repeat domain-containing protein n=1 Tax=Poseidonocella sp. HB161398 TaxID=2320855 RepID=UPI001107FFCF|nr:hypothetical protein [Poseidonocella sp. HB161398]